MRKTLLLLFFAFSSVVSATTYYVATTGNDSNPGTLSQPFASLQKAINISKPGDITYIRGGTYYLTEEISIDPQAWPKALGTSGTAGNPICYFNYPGEVPVFDFVNYVPSGNYGGGLYLNRVNFIHLKGFTIRNVKQPRDNVEILALFATDCSNITFENLKVHDCGGCAFRYAGALGYYGITTDTTFFINCDAYNNCDSRPRQPGATLGGSADGFKAWNEPGAYIVFSGCRAWDNSDDGFDPSADQITIIENCWSFKNGKLQGDGNGFKTGGIYNNHPYITRIIKNCISAFNSSYGYMLLEYPDYYRTNARFYNNVSFNDWIGYTFSRNYTYPTVLGVWKNNISYKCTNLPWMSSYSSYIESNNTWDGNSGYPGFTPASDVTVTDADFISLDIEELKSPRKSDGSLPDVNFMHLAPLSDLIDAGTKNITDINSIPGVKPITYNGSPDIGAFESSATNPNIKLVTSITVTGAGGVKTISTDNGTLQLSAAVSPADASNKTVTWSISSGTDKASISSTGLVTALDNGTAIARAIANDGSGVYGTLTITISNQGIPVSNITVTGAGGAATISSDNGTLQLSATVLPANATNKTVTWSIWSGTDKASISSTGLVTALVNGTAVARATANDGSGVYGTFTITVSNQVIPVTGITVTAAGGSTLITSIGGTLQLTAAILPSNATNKTLTWSISNGTDIASISPAGLVTSIGYGTATARATANDGSGIYGTLTIRISNQIIPVSSITVTGAGGAATIVTDNGTLQLIATVLPANATDKSVTWSILSGTDKASISSAGLVTAIDNGTVTARATANDGSGVYGTLTITILNQVITVSNITITGAGGATTITTENGTLQLSATVLPANATIKTVTWSISSGTNKASISSSGLVTAINTGTITVRATANDGSGIYGILEITISYIVNSPPVIVVNYNSSSFSGFVSEINASGSYDVNNDNLTFTWTTPVSVPVSSTSGSSIKYLGPIVSSSQTAEFTLSISDGKTTQSKVIPVEILPYKPELEVAEIAKIEASDSLPPYYPFNTIDGNIGTMWSAEGVDQWLIFKLKHPFSVQHVKLAFQPGQRKESYFDILGSVDKVNWEPILAKSASCDFSGDLQVFEFPPSKTGKEFNFIKLVGQGNATDTRNYISELKIFGYRYQNSPAYENLPVKVYPNPAREFVTIRIDESTLIPDIVKLIDLSGIVVYNGKVDPGLKEFTIPVNNLKKGIYIVQLVSGKLTLFTQKLVVIR